MKGEEEISTTEIEYEEVEKPLRKGARVKLFMSLVCEIGEGELKILMFNYLAKVRTDNEEALQMMMHGIHLGFFTLYHDGEGALTKREIMMKLIFDDNLYFKSNIKKPKVAQTTDLKEKLKKIMIHKKLVDVFSKSVEVD